MMTARWRQNHVERSRVEVRSEIYNSSLLYTGNIVGNKGLAERSMLTITSRIHAERKPIPDRANQITVDGDGAQEGCRIGIIEHKVQSNAFHLEHLGACRGILARYIR